MTDSHTNSHSHNSENGMCLENADSSYVLSVLQFDSIFQDLEILNGSFLGSKICLAGARAGAQKAMCGTEGLPGCRICIAQDAGLGMLLRSNKLLNV